MTKCNIKNEVFQPSLFPSLKGRKIKVDFASDLELDSSAVSVYTIKRFEKYSYEVVE